MQRLTVEKIKEIAKNRKHKLISLSNPENPRAEGKGKIHILCFCGCRFETTVHSYLCSKNGCPRCKRKRMKLNNPKKKKMSTPPSGKVKNVNSPSGSYAESASSLNCSAVKKLRLSKNGVFSFASLTL